MNFYGINLLFAIYCLYGYMLFRFHIDDYLHYNKKSKSFIQKNKKGWRNYWFYEKLHREFDLGARYHFNKVLLFASVVYFVFTVCLGWVEALELTITLLSLVLAILPIPTVVIFGIFENLDLFGRKSVLFAWVNGYIKGALSWLIWAGAPVFFALWNLNYVFNIF